MDVEEEEEKVEEELPLHVEEEEEHDPAQCHTHVARLQRLANWRASEVFELETTVGALRSKVLEKEAQV